MTLSKGLAKDSINYYYYYYYYYYYTTTTTTISCFDLSFFFFYYPGTSFPGDMKISHEIKIS